MKAKTIRYEGKDFEVPANYESLGYTHGVFARHVYRGPFAVRWLKSDLASTFEKRQAAIMGAYRLYGTSIENVQVLPIDESPPETSGDAVRKAA